MNLPFDDESPRARLALLLKHFSELEDDREPAKVMYPLHCGFRRIADRIPTQAGQQSDDCGQPVMMG